MGTNEESDMEQTSPMMLEETGSSGKDLPPAPPEDPDLLNTYKWHTGSKGDMGGSASLERPEKSSATKWSKMQGWRKALSEDAAEKREPAENAKPGKSTTARKNPFRRALSEPPGALFSTATNPTSSQSVASPSSAESPGSSTQEAQQRGGGNPIRKYLRTVSQKFKRPRLQSRNSTPVCVEATGPNEAQTETTAGAPDPVRLSWVPQQEVPVWDINSCRLHDGQIQISLEEEPMLRIRNRASSCLYNLSLQNLADSRTNLECNPDVVAPSVKAKETNSAVRKLIFRRFMNAAQRNSRTQLNSIEHSAVSRLHGSRESLSIPVSAVESLDLSSDQTTVIRPVHSSILGEKFCFEVINSENNHCFGCSSAAERDRWIENLRRAAQPNKDNCERTENSLSLWVNEAKDLPPKRCYYCELHLDGVLFARTSSRAIGKSPQRSSLMAEGGVAASAGSLGGGGAGAGPGGCQLFWGELFELDNLPPVSQLTLHLFRDDEAKKKRHSRDETPSFPLGSVAISLANIRGRAFHEDWYRIVPYKAAGSGGTKDQLGPQASLRVKGRFQNLRVLPIERYKEFAEFVTMNYEEMCVDLEPLLSVREKEELARALVHVLQSIGKAKEFLITLGRAEVQRCGEKEALIFRENTLATKAIDEYMKLVGQKYLIDTLGDFITRLYASAESCEVDPRKCTASELPSNQKNLREACEDVVKRITEMHESFPVELNEIFSSWVEDCEARGRVEIGQRLISASLFLRFLCPAILSPSLFGLMQPYPDPPTLRTLTLTAKVIQNLANFTSFGEKEEYMLFMNDFLQEHWEDMRSFLQRVSNPDSELAMARFDGYVDLPLRLAVLHGLLIDIISPMKQETVEKLLPLPSILNQISDSLGPSAPRITICNLRSEQTKPTYVPPRDLPEYSPYQHLPADGKNKENRAGKRVTRTQSVPNRVKPRPWHPPKRQASSENLPDITILNPSEPQQPRVPTRVPWQVIVKEPQPMSSEPEEFSVLKKHEEELSELRLGVDQVTERELEMAKRLEDFIAESEEQKEELRATIKQMQDLLTMQEEQLASTTFRLGVIEEEREEDERKLNAAMAAAERMNVLEEQFAELLKDMNKLSSQRNMQHPESAGEPDSNSN
uniref:RAS protein activator like 3 n=1 Tax=Paramormyrops kingsleyae TaxID=1676925 RepID=A0A3B3S3E6_9TELE|nr:RAS protein activator like-3-like isoform X2 [Paramormyrops kingsleyae]